MAQETAGFFLHVIDSPLSNADIEFFVDGSRYADEKGHFHTGYAVVSAHEVIKAEPLAPHCSAQEAELKALAEACKMVSGTPIKNSGAMSALMDAILLPTQVGIIKVAAHVKTTDEISRGNHKADEAAKQAAIQVHPSTGNTFLQVVLTDDAVDYNILLSLQRQASKEEHYLWRKQDAEPDDDRMWRKGKRLCLPRVLYPMMAQIAHGPTHLSKMHRHKAVLILYHCMLCSDMLLRLETSK
ncbi:uncharacterized protein LOC134601700 [Pelobates fuscus]|uniref:uncharacterized protein LOC134601700 n=1 Tax=Pelobates fuscus TaxID=191477 RepID=UPI002FE439DE